MNTEDVSLEDLKRCSPEAAAALNHINNIMEAELQCPICAELFIEATTLNCSHTFCKHCISMWKKKQNKCPVCRSLIKIECHSTVLDSFIEKMVTNMDANVEERRKQILKERKESEKIKRRIASKVCSQRRRTLRSNITSNNRIIIDINDMSDLLDVVIHFPNASCQVSRLVNRRNASCQVPRCIRRNRR